jgi:hypothetical protein
VLICALYMFSKDCAGVDGNGAIVAALAQAPTEVSSKVCNDISSAPRIQDLGTRCVET